MNWAAAMIASSAEFFCAPVKIALFTLVLRIVSVFARLTMLSRLIMAAFTPSQATRKSCRDVRMSLTTISQLLPSGFGGKPSVVRFMQASKLSWVGSHSVVFLIIASMQAYQA